MGNPGRQTFGPKKQGESLLLTAEFISSLGGTESIGSPVVTINVWSGTDPNPSAMLSGVPTASGSQVKQMVTGGVPGVVYYLTFQVTTSLNQIIQQTGYLVVLPQPVP